MRVAHRVMSERGRLQVRRHPPLGRDADPGVAGAGMIAMAVGGVEADDDVGVDHGGERADGGVTAAGSAEQSVPGSRVAVHAGVDEVEQHQPGDAEHVGGRPQLTLAQLAEGPIAEVDAGVGLAGLTSGRADDGGFSQPDPPARQQQRAAAERLVIGMRDDEEQSRWSVAWDSDREAPEQ